MRQETTSRLNLAPGSLYGQVYSGHARTRSRLGRLHASLLPPSKWAGGASLVLFGHTQAVERFLRDIKTVGLLCLTPTLPDESHLKGPMLAISLDTSDTRVILVLDPGSQYVRQHYQEWVKAGQVSIDLITPGGNEGYRRTVLMGSVDQALNGWPHRTDWEPDPLERIRQVVDAFETWCNWKKTVITSVLELLDTAAPAQSNPSDRVVVMNTANAVANK